MTEFEPSKKQQEILDGLRKPGSRLVHVKGRTSRGSGLYAFDRIDSPIWQGRTVQPLIEAGLIQASQIREVQL